MDSSSSSFIANALSQSVVVIGLNAALQKRFILEPGKNLEPGSVHRAYRCETGVGGKGQDVGVALSCLMKEKNPANDRVLLAQFLGKGPEGDAVSKTLSTEYNLPSTGLTIRNDAPLRTCTTIVASDCATELVETSGKVTDEEMKELCDRVDELTKQGGKASCVCIMGSMPPGCQQDTYADLTHRLAGKESLVLIDSVIGLDPLLSALKTIFANTDNEHQLESSNESYKSKQGGAVLKLNAAELCKLAGVAKKSGGEAERVTMDELSTSAKQFVTKYVDAIGALDYLCITDGKYPGYLVEIPKSFSAKQDVNDDNIDGSFRTWQLPAVDLSTQTKGGEDMMLYPIGAGDTVAAGTLAAWQYLHQFDAKNSYGNDDNKSKGEGFFGVISPSTVGNSLSNTHRKWSNGASSPQEEKGYKMATAFAFGLACGSASCLQQENSVFQVDHAMKFFGDMTKPILQ